MTDLVGLNPSAFLSWLRMFSKRAGPLLNKWYDEQRAEGMSLGNWGDKRIAAPFEVKLVLDYKFTSSGEEEYFARPRILLPKDIFNKVPNAETRFPWHDVSQ